MRHRSFCFARLPVEVRRLVSWASLSGSLDIPFVRLASATAEHLDKGVPEQWSYLLLVQVG